MTLPASGAIDFNALCYEFGLDIPSSAFPRDFYGKAGVASSGTIGFQSFYGKSGCPQFVAKTNTSGIAALSLAWPTHLTNDIGILVVQSSNEAIATPAGWTLLAAGTGVGTAAAANATRVSIFWCRATSAAMAAASIADTGDHTLASISTWRGCITTGNPFEGLSARATGAATGCSIANTNTVGTLRTAIAIFACSRDSSAVTWSGQTFASGKTNWTEVEDVGTTSGTGGSICVAFAHIATGQAVGTISATQATAVNWEGYSFALIGANGSASGGSAVFNPVSGTYSANDNIDVGQAEFSITADQSVTWTWSSTQGVGFISSVSNGGSATSITFNLSGTMAQSRSATVTVSAGGSNWTINMFASQLDAGGVTVAQ